MRRMLRPWLEPPRTVSAPAGVVPASYRAWIEVAAQLAVEAEPWGASQREWLHWAVPVRDGEPAPEAARTFDPARRAAWSGAPPASRREGEPRLDAERASALCAALAQELAPSLFRSAELGLVSRLGESRAAFKARCLDAAAPAMARGGAAGTAGRRALATLVGAIEERRLGAEELRFESWRVGVGWYPEGIEPVAPAAEPLLHATGGRRR